MGKNITQPELIKIIKDNTAIICYWRDRALDAEKEVARLTAKMVGAEHIATRKTTMMMP